MGSTENPRSAMAALNAAQLTVPLESDFENSVEKTSAVEALIMIFSGWGLVSSLVASLGAGVIS